MGLHDCIGRKMLNLAENLQAGSAEQCYHELGNVFKVGFL